MQLLREFIKQILQEEAASASITQDISQQILKKLEMEAIPRGENEHGFLSSGKYGVVYEVLWKGKRAVVKITRDKQELDSARKIRTIKEGIPKEIGVHLPTIHQTYVLNSNDRKYYVIILEYLNPIPASIKALVFGANRSSEFKNTVKTNMSVLLKDKDLLKEKIREIVKNEAPEPYTKDEKANEKILNFLTNAAFTLTVKFLENNIENIPSTNTKWKIVRPNLVAAADALQEEYEDMPLIDVDLINTQISELFHSQKNLFPLDPEEDRDDFEFKDPRVKALYDAMKWLDNKNITRWGDLHQNNVLMRNNDTLVAVDVGLFHYPKQKRRRST